MSPIRLVEAYLPGTAKGGCYICGASQRTIDGRPETVIHTAIEISFEGTLAICESCVREAAHELGLVTTDIVEAAKAEVVGAEWAYAAAVELLEAAEARATEAEDALRTVVQLVPRSVAAPAPEPVAVVDEPSPVATDDAKAARKGTKSAK